MAAVPVYSITRAEIDEFWSRKEVEAEERRLAAEKEAARITAKTLKQMEDYVLYEQMVREILMEGNGGDGSAIAAAATGGTTEAQIVGIKHWWTRSAYAYLNTPALSMDGNGRSNKHANAIPYVPQERCTAIFCSSTPRQPNVDALAIF
ncbi:OSJNBa0084K11.10-like protein [Zea mays]|uniref:OSJNBa0084K11.10-like protein n=2 Tax=Zea mays TaxID=4577 RepID=A0A1D6JD06_MAIZE|nr:OSJNBa0084K11.10-like protein [Zea mays]